MATRQTDVGVRSVIETPRLRLEPWDDSHFDRFARFMRDPEVTRYIRPSRSDSTVQSSSTSDRSRSGSSWDSASAP